MQKLSADTDKLPVDFAKTSHTIDNFYQLFRIHTGGHYNAHDVPKAPTYPIKRILDHSFLIEYTPNISKREIYSTDGKIMFYYSTDGKIMFYYSTDGKIMFYYYYSTDGKTMFYYSTDGKIMFYPRNK